MFDDLDIPNPLEMLPPLVPPAMDSRQNEAMLQAVLIDISGVIGWIPILGDLAADCCEDFSAAKLRDILTPEEMERYVHHDRVGPSTLAMIKAFQGSKGD